MIYSQFQQSPFQNRFSGVKGWMAFAIGLAVITLTLIALPFVLLIGAVSFILLSLFGRIFLKRQLARFRQQQEQGVYGAQQQEADFSQANVERDSQVFTESPFAERRPRVTPHQGRTFEHDPS
ncbi:conserved hypothetical protein [Shewanella sediminis HAW-EB3]|uniref:Uncharacterized protein n=1 Tax=Shewanella sediminis (strain HAW-EB3) TaxID=425104 RepID=A8FPU2_SHESH|nr:hypothetical protein [Shewanella sediminis]ABV34865.1 conserved hypothetical protein [Shewanella sediminis HAW-EB3]